MVKCGAKIVVTPLLTPYYNHRVFGMVASRTYTTL